MVMWGCLNGGENEGRNWREGRRRGNVLIREEGSGRLCRYG